MIRGPLLVVLLAAVGCKDGPPDPAATDAGGWSAAPSGRESKKVGKDDCAAWAAHGVDVVLADWKAAATDCPADARKALTEKLDGQTVTIRGSAVEVCSRHLGEAYAPADASCYLRARTARALADCRFAPMTNPGDSDIVGEIERLRTRCAQAKDGGGRAGSPL
jgi:hypothetical protein